MARKSTYFQFCADTWAACMHANHIARNGFINVVRPFMMINCTWDCICRCNPSSIFGAPAFVANILK